MSGTLSFKCYPCFFRIESYPDRILAYSFSLTVSLSVPLASTTLSPINALSLASHDARTATRGLALPACASHHGPRFESTTQG